MHKLKQIVSQPQVWGFFVSIAVMAIIALAFFAPDNFQGNSLMQSDIQQGAANGQEAAAYQQATGEKALWTNSLFSGMPTFQISPSYPSNKLFTWINTLYGLGLPSPSNLLFMMMFGFLIMLYCMRMRWTYALVGAIAWGFSSYYIIIIGAGHIWKFLALTYIPPTIGGLVLLYRGRWLLGASLTALFAMMQLNANHPQMTYYFGFVMAGLAIAYLVDAIREYKLARWCAASAILVGAGLLAVGANLPSLYNTYEYAKETKRSQSELASAAPSSATAQRPTGGLPKGEIVNWSYGGSEMFSLLIPNVKGGASAKPEAGRMVALTLADLDSNAETHPSIQPMMQIFSQYFNDSEGTNGPVYVGAIVCALFLLGCIAVRGPLKWTLVVLTVLSALLALGRNFEPLTDFMIYNFPMYSKFRAVESILVIAEFTMPLLAVLALAQLLQADAVGRKQMLPALYWSFAICAGIALVGAFAPSIFGNAITSQDQQTITAIQQQYPDANIPVMAMLDRAKELRYGMVSADCWRALAFLALGFALLLFYAKGSLKSAYALAGVGVLILVDLYTADKRYVDHDSFASASPMVSQYDPYAPDAIDQAILQDHGLSYRVLDIPGFGQPLRSYHHKMIGGYHAAKLNRYEDLIQNRMQHLLGIGYHPELLVDSIRQMYGPEDQEILDQLAADYRVLNMLNGRYVITGEKDAPLVYNPDALGNAWLVGDIEYVDDARAEMDALATLDPATQAVADRKFMEALGDDYVAPNPNDKIELVAYTPNKLTYKVSATTPAIGVFSEVYFPWGWHATIDGVTTPLARVNYVLRALRIPAGEHEVVMTFDPQSIHVTSTIAYICVTLIYLLLLCAIFTAIASAETRKQQ